MQNLLARGQTPEAWSDTLKSHGVHVSPRLVRSKARETGQFFQMGRLMLLTPEQVESLFDTRSAILAEGHRTGHALQ